MCCAMVSPSGARLVAPTVLQIPAPPSDTDYSKDPAVWDMVIIGAGIAGCALAHSRGLRGARVLLVERDLAQPDRFVGEFLQPGGIAKLRDLGLEHCIEDIDAQEINGICFKKDGIDALLPYSEAGVCFHHGRFVQRLRHAAAAHKSVTVRQGVATALLNADGKILTDEDSVGGVLYRSTDGVDRRARARLTVLCDGMHSNLRAKVSVPKITPTAFEAAVTLTGCHLPDRNLVQVLAEQPCVSLYPISSSEIRCMMIIPGKCIPKTSDGSLRQYLTKNVAPRLPDEAREAFFRALDTEPVRNLQTKMMPAVHFQRAGAVLLGDSLNMRHPATGSGMTLAFNDVKILADMLDQGKDFTSVKGSASSTAAFLAARKPLSVTMNLLSNLVYNVYGVPKGSSRECTKEVIHGYLGWGGRVTAGMVRLVGGLDERPHMVLLHSLGIAALGIWHIFLSSPSLRSLRSLVAMLWDSIGVMWPLLLAEGGPAVFLASFQKPRQVITNYPV